MSKVLALVGRSNVGKSTLFNRLTKTRDALVADIPGLTRDRQYGVGKLAVDDGQPPYIVIDSGGLSDKPQEVEALMAEQVWHAVEEADGVLFIVDGRIGINAGDQEIAINLRKANKPIFLVVNKTEGLKLTTIKNEFYGLGIGEPYLISAAHNHNVKELVEFICNQLPDNEPQITTHDDVAKIAIIGRPNVGKSTLINRLIGEDRLLTYDMPGTTRDSISVEFSEDGKQYLLIDTAGVRRCGKINQTIEKFSVIKTIAAINAANAVVVLIDGHEGFTDQDANLLSMAVNSGKALVLGINKWDGMDNYQRQQVKIKLERSLHFVDYVPIFFISALYGSNIRDLFAEIEKVYQTSMTKMPTNKLSNGLEQAVRQHAPPLIKGHRIKLRYAHQGGQNPPLIIIHGNQADKVPDSYRRYLINHFRQLFNLTGTPIKIEFRTSSNPFQGQKNTLTKRQIAKKLRLKKHNK